MRKFRLPLVRPSTLEFLREARRTPDYNFFDWLHGMAYARWPYLYIGIGVGEHPLARRFVPWFQRFARLQRWLFPPPDLAACHPPNTVPRPTFADTYHGKVVPLEAARQLVMVNEDVRLPDLESVIPYLKARAIILQNPDHIVALQCPCRSARADPCLPLDVCLIVGEPFASYVLEHHPQRSRWISQSEAAAILQAEDERGHVHHAFFKDAMLGRFYAICNCCACCCGAMNAHRHGTPMLASSGYLAQVDHELCIACGDCASFCQFQALSIVDFVNQVDEERCMGCGICASKCPQEAIGLQLAPGKGVPLEIISLMGIPQQSRILQ